MRRGGSGRSGIRSVAIAAVQRRSSAQNHQASSADERDDSERRASHQVAPENTCHFSGKEQQGQQQQEEQQGHQHRPNMGPSRNLSTSMQSPKGSRVHAQRREAEGSTEPEYDPKLWSIVPVSTKTEASEADTLSDRTVLGGLFSTRKPKDAGAGLSSGLKSVGKGVAVGAASLFVLPAVGAAQQGVGGFFKGIGAGVVAAVALPITGICIAGYQVTRGLINTPEAIHEKSQGKKWDKKERVWKPNWYSLQEEAADILNRENPHKRDPCAIGGASSKSGSQGASGERKVVDTTFYDVLEVSTDARPEEIRRQYYRLARKYHPDKNPDDPLAKKRFQQLGEAYQVLGEEERRAQYDLHGQAAAQDMPIIDSSLFFMMLFGSEALEPYIGKLKMAMFVEMVDAPGSKGLRGDDISEDMFAFEQRKREVQLAVLLQQRVQPYVDAMLQDPQNEAQQQRKVDAWKGVMTNEAKNLCQSSFGDAILEAIAWTYENYATQYLGKLDTFLGLGGRYAKMQAQSRSVGNSWRTAAAAVRAAVAARQLQQREQKRAKKQEKAKKKAKDGEQPADSGPTAEDVKQFEETLPLILETMLSICLMDIETTVRAAAKKVVKDMSVSVEVRRLRAEALVALGKIIQQEADDFKAQHKNDKVDPLRRMEDALIKAAQKADEERYKREGDHTGPPPPEAYQQSSTTSRFPPDFL
ncbi:chaperone protein dnaJ 10 [Cyclospora cayetanensis]|uniref:Chaperone protein dnaJ 10 n=1 Tax=Cyclospora cayetanensis TaxID=88456 RepID=A0A6P6S429_9EIME|nr:chaperone protein dnaJ 10 [Cyclospora cayetanensis]